MSQLSLFSDAGPSSVVGSDLTFDNLLDSFTPDLPASQQSVTTAPDPDFLRPLTIPLSLERDGPDRKKSFILFSEMSKNEFVEWWLQTDFGSKLGHQGKIRWDAKHTSNAWKNFDQVAHYITGEPKVLCQRCKKTLPHPHYTGHGTNSMGRHLSGEKCQKSTGRTLHQQDLHQSLQSAVNPLILNLSI